MVLRENQVIVVFGVLAIDLLYTLATFTDLPAWVSVAVVSIAGVIVLQLVSGPLSDWEGGRERLGASFPVIRGIEKRD